jgi:hypothetical protein
MFTKLEDHEVGQHIHDLADSNYGMIPVDIAEECATIFIRTFADIDMREEYEAIWHDSAKPWSTTSIGCPENCRCRQ